MYQLALYISFVVFFAVLIWYARQPIASTYHPITMYLAFHGFVFVVRPLFAFYNEYHGIYVAYDFFPSEATKLAVIFCANLGMLAFVAAAWLSGDEPLVFRRSPAHAAHRRMMIKPFLVALALCAPIGLASLSSIVSSPYEGMIRDRGSRISINTSGNGWFNDAHLMLVPCSMLFAWVFQFRWWTMLPLLGFALSGASFGSRGPFVVGSVAVGLAYLFERRAKFPNWKALLALTLLVASFVQVGEYRGREAGSSQDIAVEKIVNPSEFMERMDFANLEFFEFIVETIPEKTGTYGYFVDNLQLFTEPIPRKLWKDKPVGAPIKMFDLFEHGNPIGMTASLPGQGWAQLGYFGVLFWCALWGWALGWAYKKFATSRQDTFAVGLYLSFLPAFVIAFRDGGLLTVARSVVFYLSPILLTAVIARLLEVPSIETLERALRRARRPRRGVVEPPPPEPAPPSPPQRRRRTPAIAPVIVPRAWRRRGPAPAE